MLSILIPTYNDSCLALTNELQRQIDKLQTSANRVGVEVIVADDCSTNSAIIEENNKINSLHNCRVIRAEHNLGRAGIRNFLADNAKGDWLLFIDGDMKMKNDRFIENYIDSIIDTETQVVYGGYSIDNSNEDYLKGNLRYKAEREAEAKKTLSARLQHPYNHFHTANFLISSCVFHKIRFNDKMKLYGFEDVLFGKQLKENGFAIKHIDNPVFFVDFESNAEYIRKTDESLKTQQQFSDLIGDYSTLIRTHSKIKKLRLTWLLSIINKCIGKKIKANILGENPSIFAFNLYKLLTFNKNK